MLAAEPHPTPAEPGVLYCQVCGSSNSEEDESCRRCGQLLLVVSGPYTEEDQEAFEADPESQFSFDEHLLERISILEEALRRTAAGVRQALSTVYKLEQQTLVAQTGLESLAEVLGRSPGFSREEWSELWESRVDNQLLALEKRDRFAAVKDNIGALYRGPERSAFERRLDEADLALFAFDIEAALRALHAAYELDPQNYELAFFLGETSFNEGDAELAAGFFRAVLEARPEHYEGLVYSGVLSLERGQVDEARGLLERAVELYPSAFLPVFSLGAVYASHGRLEPAIRCLERAVDLDPIPQAHYLLGGCSYRIGRVGKAIRHLREAVRLDPAFEDAYHLLGLAFLDRRWVRKALQALRAGQRLEGQTLGFGDLVELLDLEEALTPDRWPAEVARWALEGRRAVDEGQAALAVSSYRRALAIEPQDPHLLLAYSMVCLELGRGTEVETAVDKLLSADIGERLRTSAYAILMESHRRSGNFGSGIRIGRLLLAEDASDLVCAVACYELAYDLSRSPEGLEEALELAQESVRRAPTSARAFALAALGWVHLERGEHESAAESLRESTDLRPTARTLTHLAMALLASRQRTAAREALVRARDLAESRLLEEKVLECLEVGTRRHSRTGARMPRPLAG